MRKLRGKAVAAVVLMTMAMAPAMAWGVDGARSPGDNERVATLMSTVLETAQVSLAGWIDQLGGLLTAAWDASRGVIVPGDGSGGGSGTGSASTTTMSAPAGGA